MGHPRLHSGQNVKVEGFGRWDSAVFQMEEVTHSYSKSAGYTTVVLLRGVLGY